jgi:anti-sigma B factor antagonist
MAGPDYPVTMLGGVPVVEAPQEIDAANAEWFGKILLHAAQCEHATVVVNMTGTRFCDSAGVHVLARAHERVTGVGGRLLLVVPPAGAVDRVFTLTGLDQAIPMFGDLKEALEQVHAVVPRPLEGRP